MSRYAWFGIGLILLLIIAQIDSRIGGWLLIVIVLGLIWNAHEDKPGRGRLI